jgi:hypothetical protein
MCRPCKRHKLRLLPQDDLKGKGIGEEMKMGSALRLALLEFSLATKGDSREQTQVLQPVTLPSDISMARHEGPTQVL